MLVPLLRGLANFGLSVLPSSRCFGIKRGILRIAGHVVGNNVSLNYGVRLFGRGRIVLGENTWLGPRCVFYTHETADIVIGKYCDIAPEVSFLTGSHTIGPSERRAGAGWAKPISIGDGCWIGARATILGGVDVGAGSVIAAGAIVTRNVPENALVGGVPSHLIRLLDERSE